MTTLVISTSLSPSSRSRILAHRAHELLGGAWLDLAELQVPHCDGHDAWNHPDAARVTEAVAAADGILIAMGVYNYAGSAMAKTVLEIAGRAFGEKVVGFLCAAGGERSYMSVLPLANSLMLDFRSVIVPRFVYATGAAFNDDGELADDGVEDRIASLTEDLKRMARALRPASG